MAKDSTVGPQHMPLSPSSGAQMAGRVKGPSCEKREDWRAGLMSGYERKLST